MTSIKVEVKVDSMHFQGSHRSLLHIQRWQFMGHLIIPKEGIENARVDPGGSQMKKMGREEAITRNRRTKRDLPEKATVRLREEGETR